MIVITGASSGIGLATARMAAKKGAKVVLSSRNSQELKEIVADIKRAGGTSFAVTADVANQSDIENLKEQALAKFGRIDTWVNNAGVGIFGEIMDTPIEEARALFDINFWGLHYGSMAAIDAMKNGDGGVIINLGSEVSERAMSLQAFYSASKHAIRGYNEGLRTEIEKKGWPIAFTLIRPAAIDTPFTAHSPNHLREGEPSLSSPVYHPDIAATAICEAAQTGKRDIYIGGSSKLASMLNHVVPGLLDYVIMGQTKDMVRGEKTPHLKRNEGLLSKPAREGKVRGGHKGHVMSTSVWTSASLHPVVTGAAILGAGALAYGLVSYNSKSE